MHSLNEVYHVNSSIVCITWLKNIIGNPQFGVRFGEQCVFGIEQGFVILFKDAQISLRQGQGESLDEPLEQETGS